MAPRPRGPQTSLRSLSSSWRILTPLCVCLCLCLSLPTNSCPASQYILLALASKHVSIQTLKPTFIVTNVLANTLVLTVSTLVPS